MFFAVFFYSLEIIYCSLLSKTKYLYVCSFEYHFQQRKKKSDIILFIKKGPRLQYIVSNTANVTLNATA